MQKASDRMSETPIEELFQGTRLYRYSNAEILPLGCVALSGVSDEKRKAIQDACLADFHRRRAGIPDPETALRRHLDTLNARQTCPVCDCERWVRDLHLELYQRHCSACGLIQRFDPASFGYRRLCYAWYSRAVGISVSITELTPITVAPDVETTSGNRTHHTRTP